MIDELRAEARKRTCRSCEASPERECGERYRKTGTHKVRLEDAKEFLYKKEKGYPPKSYRLMRFFQ